MDKQRLVSELLVSISGVIIFLSVSYWIDLNGYSEFAPVLMLVGVSMLIWSDFFVESVKSIQYLKFIHKPIVQSISHILIFIGLKAYLSKYITDYWIITLIIGIILLNQHKQIAKKLFPGG